MFKLKKFAIVDVLLIMYSPLRKISKNILTRISSENEKITNITFLLELVHVILNINDILISEQ